MWDLEEAKCLMQQDVVSLQIEFELQKARNKKRKHNQVGIMGVELKPPWGFVPAKPLNELLNLLHSYSKEKVNPDLIEI